MNKVAKKIRFSLEMDDGIEVRSIEELKENFSLDRVLLYISNGKMQTWLRDRYLNDIADELLKLNQDDATFNRKVCDIFEVEYDCSSKADMEKAAERNRKMKLLQEFTSEKKFFDIVDQIAFDQNDMYDLLDEDENSIYLCGNKFSIPLSKKGVRYIGINNPVVVISSKEKVDFKEKEISFENIKFDEKYAQLIATDEIKEEVAENFDGNNANCSGNQFSKECCEQVNTFVENMIEFVDEFVEEFENDFEDKYIDECSEITELDSSDYGSNFNKYSTKAKAKTDCKKNIQLAIDDILRDCNNEKERVVKAGNDFISEIEDAFQNFIEEFIDSYNEYTALECDNEAEKYINEKRNSVFSEEVLNKKLSDLNLDTRFNSLIKEVFDTPISNLLNVKKYFDMCTYDSSDGDYYYDPDCAIDEINSDVDTFIDYAIESFCTRTKELHEFAIKEYCDEFRSSMRQMLVEMGLPVNDKNVHNDKNAYIHGNVYQNIVNFNKSR